LARCICNAERNEALCVFEQSFEADMRLLVRARLEMRFRGELHEPAIALGVLRNEHEFAAGVCSPHRQRAADDGLYACLRRRFREFERAKKIVGVGDADGGHALRRRELRQILHVQHAPPQGISRAGA
jgi:hypothetical protein